MRHYFNEAFNTAPPGRAKLRLNLAGGNVCLYQRGKDHFAVVYGKQVDDALSYAEACAKLGQALMHWAACEGRLDNRMPGETC